MNDTWINHAVYPLLDRISNFQNYFDSMAQILAATCFLMAVGMACIKIFLQVANAREQIIKLGMTLVIYLVMLFFYPVVTKAILPFAQNIGYEVIFASGDYTVTVPDSSSSNASSSVTKSEKKLVNTKPTKQDFYEWLGEHTGDIFTTSTSTDATGAVKEALDINIVDRNTGRIDLNKTFKYCLAFLSAAWECMPAFHLSVVDVMLGLFYLIAMLVAIVCYIVVVINYVMCLLDYYFMTGFGLFFLPLSLWEGSKQYTQGLIGNFVQILVKLMIISAIMFLSIMSMIDMFVEVYMQSTLVAGKVIGSNYGGMLQFACTLIFQGLLLYVMTMQTTKIASMLCGGQPQMSFGEFAHAAAQGVATGAAAHGIQKGMGKAALAAVSGGTSAVMSGMATAKAGGSARDIARSVGASAGQSVAGGLKSLKENAPDAVKKASQSFSAMTGLGIPGGEEGGAFNPYSVISSGKPSKAPQGNGYGAGSQANSEEKNGLKTGGGTESIADGKGGMSSRFSGEGSTGGGIYNSAQWQSGNEGVYGNAGNKDGTVSGNIQNMLTRGANRQAVSGSTIQDFKNGAYSAFGGNVIRALRQTHAERAAGNVQGNGYMKSVLKAAGATASQSARGLANRGNVFTTTPGDPSGNLKLSAFLGGSGKYMDSGGNYINYMDRNKDSYGAELVQAGDSDGYSQFRPTLEGPSDSDAVNFARDATKDAQKDR